MNLPVLERRRNLGKKGTKKGRMELCEREQWSHRRYGETNRESFISLRGGPKDMVPIVGKFSIDGENVVKSIILALSETF